MKLFLSRYYYLLQRCFSQNSKTYNPHYFLIPFLTNTMKYLNPNDIESINSIKKDTVINNSRYSGQIHIRSKNPTNTFFNLRAN
jgi:hypothetical protein